METQAFQQLKIAIERFYQSRYPDCAEPIQDWKGKEIRRFQQDLSERVQGQVSEKWFYTHIKNSEADKLPRTDALNLLAQYIGFDDWLAFLATQPIPSIEETVKTVAEQKEVEDEAEAVEETVSEEPIILEKPSITTPKAKKRWEAMLLVAATLVGLLVVIVAMQWKTQLIEYDFCFVNADDNQPIRGLAIEVAWLKSGESPTLLTCDTATGCVRLSATPADKIQLAVNAPYYRKDTLMRVLPNNNGSERIALRTDDYALMLHYFSKTDLKDWKKRREKLDAMLNEELQAVQVYGEAAGGIALYNKQEFIDKLTMPLETLKNIEILETQYDDYGQILYLRFR